ncbi:hypothetical protein GCM10023172_39590 [Hymenobacter ginsengisoli]|uniref:Glycosyltransferase RgtA/B/C/D-like domain-containing protein n=1 Tax=Hymenobacter ginsengisoli TaxID=1051626 RepID=A0ABP8QPK3_9BACT|nr:MULTISPECIES: hypothetical protein [unclassified Hymenobacter]MBO2032906.1 hypothetical protein [Hymenobacter sp. BT559]
MPARATSLRLRTGRLWPSVAVAGLLTALCLAMPTRNATGDAWYYAACSRWGQELWQPHHLLYNAIGWGWLRLVGASGPAPAGELALPWLQMLNALAAGASLLALGRLLWRAGAPTAAIPAWLLLVGSCFGMLRFATDNETYNQPLLLALLASLAWARAVYADAGRRRWLVLAGLLAALACLVHQLMVWWWLGLLLGLRPWQGRRAVVDGLCYSLPALLVPLAYALAAPSAGVGAVVRFALHDYLTGGARVELGASSLLFTAISLVRTAVQVHGNMLPLLLRWPLLLGGVALASLGLAVYGGLGGWRVVATRDKSSRRQPARTVRRTHVLIGGLHLVFAVQAAGNAEFMMMLPALAATGLAGGALLAWPPQRVAALGVALLSWNLAFGLVPAHLLDYTGTGPALRARVLGEPGAWFLLREPNVLRNQLHYYTGQPDAAPRIVGLARQDATTFRRWLAARLAAGDVVYTDALGGHWPFDRAQMAQGNLAQRLLSGLAARRLDSVSTFFGPRYLSRLGPAAEAIPAPRSHPMLNASAAVKAGASK